MGRKRVSVPRWAVTVAASTVAVGLSATVAPAQHTDRVAEPVVVARGLDNPRHLSVAPDGELLIAEAGRGGTESCGEGPEGPQCFGHTGAVTSVARGRQRRVVTGLPSSAAPKTGGGASGPADVVRTSSRRLAVLLGFGGPPAKRATLGAAYAQMGTLLEADERSGRRRVLADPLAFEAKANPHPKQPDTNPNDLERAGHGWVITDAGANDVLGYGGRGAHGRHGGDGGRLLAVLPDRQVTGPGGQPMTVESVPTVATRGPDGALYVGELTGFPFPRGGSTIWRVVPGKAPTAYATGLTNVTDLAWSGRTLYAVQLADEGLFPPAPGGPPKGSVRRITRGASKHEAAASGLTAPYGIAVRGRTAYVTTCAMCAGQGEVLAFKLR